MGEKIKKNRKNPTGREPKYLWRHVKLKKNAEIRSAWWDDKRLIDLSKTDIVRHVQKENPNVKINTIYEKIDDCVKIGMLEKTDTGRYRPVWYTPIEKETPATFIKNRNFSGFFCIPLSQSEYMHYYGFKLNNGNDRGDSLPINIIPEFKKLGDTIRMAITHFRKKTGEIPRIVTYTDYGRPEPTSYVFGKLRYEIFTMILQNKDKLIVEQEMLNSKLEKDINRVTNEILREAILNWYSIEKKILTEMYNKLNVLKDSPDKLRSYLYNINQQFDSIIDDKKINDLNEFLKDLSDNVNRIKNDVSYIERANKFDIDVIARGAIVPPKEELDHLIKREAEKLYKKLRKR